ncbi:MAG: hypothetical protein HY069_03625 [Chlamydiia bacterium]|nr:hypothetical protein [Chlamydiia bacterium]
MLTSLIEKAHSDFISKYTKAVLDGSSPDHQTLQDCMQRVNAIYFPLLRVLQLNLVSLTPPQILAVNILHRQFVEEIAFGSAVFNKQSPVPRVTVRIEDRGHSVVVGSTVIYFPLK